MKRSLRAVLPFALLAANASCAPALLPPATTAPVTPVAQGRLRTSNAVFTSTRQVTSLAALPDGTLWVGTSGGVLRRGPDGVWRKWTRLDGLPAHEVRAVAVAPDGAVEVTLPRAVVAWRNQAWTAAPARTASGESRDGEGETCRTLWRGVPVAATLSGLRIGAGIGQRRVALPAQSRGTHVSALLARGDTLWAALFGDGLWTWDGKAWRTANIGLPAQAREITALAAWSDVLWIGTRRAGVWQRAGGRWTQHLAPDEPFDHNVQALALHNGALLAGTLEDGLAVRGDSGWRHETGTGPSATITSDAPRQMVVFDGALYLRHGNGRVDRRDANGQWTRNVFPDLPRKQVSALAADGDRLYVAQWGGWSEWDRKTWTHRLNLPELQGLPITVLLPDGDTIWVGTQGRGLAEVDRATGRVRWHDERSGMPDDWITALARTGKTLWAGTFVGGLARCEGRAFAQDGPAPAGPKWTAIPELAGQNVTDLETEAASGDLFVATRSGVWRQRRDGALEPLGARFPFLDTEVQALRATGDGGLWIGTRTGLFFCRP